VIGRWKVPIWLLPVIVLLGILSGCATSGTGPGTYPGFAGGSSSGTTCASPSWTMKLKTPTDGQWVAGGIVAVRNAKTSAQAHAAALVVLNDIRVYPSELARLASVAHIEQISPNKLINSNGCATAAAVTLYNKMVTALDKATIVPDQAPSFWFNSFTSNSGAYSSTSPGISGNRTAIKITIGGVTFYVLGRCGNLATPGMVPMTPAPTHPTPVPSRSTSTPRTPVPSTSTSAPQPKPTLSTHAPQPKPSKSTPAPTCTSVYGPGYSGTYPNCPKDGTSAPPPPTQAPGPNPTPSTTASGGSGSGGGPGSNQCYDTKTGNPVPPNSDGTCPSGSYGG
jgi:hypothetical protein